MENTKPHEALRLQISKVSDIMEIGPKFSDAVSVNHLLSMILKQTLDLMAADVCIIWLKDKAGNLVPRISFGLRTSLILSVSLAHTSKSVKCIMNKIKPTNIYDLAKDNRVPIKKLIKKEGLKSLLAAPLSVADERIGVLMICSKRSRRRFHRAEAKIFDALAKQSALAIANIGLYSKTLDRIHQDYLNTIKTLARIIDANDSYTRGHCEKVMKYSLMICKRLRLAEKDTNAIKTASLLHDIGKVGIDLSVIKKAGKLSKNDWKKIRMHPEIGARILSQVGFLNEIVPIVKHHHERYGGGGYPDPARMGKKIPIGARIIAIADAFDAMTSDRPYRKAMAWEDAIKELKRCSSSQFDPKIVDAFLDVAKVK